MALSRFPLVLFPVACGVALFCSCATLPRRSVPGSNSLSNIEGNHQNAIRININTASASELEKLPGIGAALAERIVAHREQYGAFRRAEHLIMVRGISEKKFRELQALVRVE